MDQNVSAIADLETHILEHIPLSRAMHVQVARYTGDEIEMTAPLAPNINDKGCAFGGSMAALLTLAGWGLIELGLRRNGLACDIYVGDSHVRYREPLWGELHGRAHFAEHGAMAALLTALHGRGKGCATVVSEIAGGSQPAATLTARFFARLHAPA